MGAERRTSAHARLGNRGGLAAAEQRPLRVLRGADPRHDEVAEARTHGGAHVARERERVGDLDVLRCPGAIRSRSSARARTPPTPRARPTTRARAATVGQPLPAERVDARGIAAAPDLAHDLVGAVGVEHRDRERRGRSTRGRSAAGARRARARWRAPDGATARTPPRAAPRTRSARPRSARRPRRARAPRPARAPRRRGSRAARRGRSPRRPSRARPRARTGARARAPCGAWRSTAAACSAMNRLSAAREPKPSEVHRRAAHRDPPRWRRRSAARIATAACRLYDATKPPSGCA